MRQPSQRVENTLRENGYRLIAGIDEAGRGSWAGPIVAAAVIMPRKFSVLGINDSKRLSPTTRNRLYGQITQTAVSIGFGVVGQRQIDEIGIGQANILALRRSIYRLGTKPDYILIDGFKLQFRKIPSQHYIKGDSRIISIAAASIMAKVYRDRLMERYHRQFSGYGFAEHKGYGTTAHRRALRRHGPCVLHRRSFEPMKSEYFV